MGDRRCAAAWSVSCPAVGVEARLTPNKASILAEGGEKSRWSWSCCMIYVFVRVCLCVCACVCVCVTSS